MITTVGELITKLQQYSFSMPVMVKDCFNDECKVLKVFTSWKEMESNEPCPTCNQPHEKVEKVPVLIVSISY